MNEDPQSVWSRLRLRCASVFREREHLPAASGSGTSVKVTLEIEADIPAGAPDDVVRTVVESCRTVRFQSHGFEEQSDFAQPQDVDLRARSGILG